MTDSPEHGSRLVATFENAWDAIRSRHPDVPEVLVVAGRALDNKDHHWGHFAYHPAGVWSVGRTGDDLRPELYVSGEAVSEGGRAVMRVLLHEAAHGLAYARGLKDTSNSCRYHNRTFVDLADELGLLSPTVPDPVIGFSDSTVPDTTAAEYAAVIAALDDPSLPYADHLRTRRVIAAERDQRIYARHQLEVRQCDKRIKLEEAQFAIEMRRLDRLISSLDVEWENAEEEPSTRAGKRVTAVCCCTPSRRLQLTPRSLTDGPILCGLCMKPFRSSVPLPAPRPPGRQPTRTSL